MYMHETRWNKQNLTIRVINDSIIDNCMSLQMYMFIYIFISESTIPFNQRLKIQFNMCRLQLWNNMDEQTLEHLKKQTKSA